MHVELNYSMFIKKCRKDDTVIIIMNKSNHPQCSKINFEEQTSKNFHYISSNLLANIIKSNEKPLVTPQTKSQRV